jgi:soluble lytic murein transglycosylase-like protein
MNINWRVIASLLLLIAAGGFAVTAFAIPEINRKRAAPYLAAFAAAEAKYGLPNDLLNRIAYQESRYDKNAVSKAGALGIMQFMPATANEYGIDPLDPFQSIDAAGRYLARLYSKFKDWKLAIASYNAGEGNVAKYGGIPPFDETREYVASIIRDIGLV